MVSRSITLSVMLLAAPAFVFSGCSGSNSPNADEVPTETLQEVEVKPVNNDPSKVHTTYRNDFYHTKNCDDLGNENAYAGSIEEAKRDGYTPCPKCNPPS